MKKFIALLLALQIFNLSVDISERGTKYLSYEIINTYESFIELFLEAGLNWDNAISENESEKHDQQNTSLQLKLNFWAPFYPSLTFTSGRSSKAMHLEFTPIFPREISEETDSPPPRA